MGDVRQTIANVVCFVFLSVYSIGATSLYFLFCLPILKNLIFNQIWTLHLEFILKLIIFDYLMEIQCL